MVLIRVDIHVDSIGHDAKHVESELIVVLCVWWPGPLHQHLFFDPQNLLKNPCFKKERHNHHQQQHHQHHQHQQSTLPNQISRSLVFNVQETRLAISFIFPSSSVSYLNGPGSGSLTIASERWGHKGKVSLPGGFGNSIKGMDLVNG